MKSLKIAAPYCPYELIIAKTTGNILDFLVSGERLKSRELKFFEFWHLSSKLWSGDRFLGGGSLFLQ